MARLTAAEAAEKWGRRLKGSTEDIRRGVQRVTEAPGVAAARNQDAMIQNLVASVQDGTWAARVSGVSLEDWKARTIDKGINRIAAGVDAAQTKQVQVMEQVLAAVDATTAEISRMPNVTLEDRINRMTAYARGMAGRKIRRPR